MHFSYTAVQRQDGRRVNGRVAATDVATLRQQLEERGLFVIRIAQARSVPRLGPARKHTIAASRAVAAFLSAGLPLTRALRATEDAVQPMRRVLASVRSSIERGETASAAFSHFPEHFDSLYIATLRAGESTGELAESFEYITTHLEREADFRGRLASSAIYPAVLLLAGGAALATMVVYVLPQFADLIVEAGAELPASTRRLMHISSFVSDFGARIVACMVIGALGLAASVRTTRGRFIMSHALLRIPGAGAVRRMVLAARISRMMAVLLNGGVPLYHALSRIEECTLDAVAASAVRDVRTQVRQGTSLSAALSSSMIAPPVMVQLIKVGEGSGALADYASRAAELMETDVQRALQRLTALLEPTVIIVFGLATGIIALSLLQVIYGVNVGAGR